MSEGIIYGNLSPSGRLATPAVGHVEELIDQRAATVVAAGRPDIPATTPYSSAQLNAMPSGTVYRSTDGPQGTWEWQKRGTAWVVTSGDTGWRVMPPPTGFEAIADRFRIRRTGSEIRLVFRIAPSAELVGQSRPAADPVLFDLLPYGFRFSPSETYIMHGQSFIGDVPNGTISGATSANRLVVAGLSGTWAAGDVFNGATTWTTDQVWPTTLPGSPS